MYKFGTKVNITKDNQWLNTTKEYYRWKKTAEFKKWQTKQFLKQGGLCWYCQDFLPLTKQNVEHKTARSLGGKNNKNNLVIACANCNKNKGAKVLTSTQRHILNKQNKNHKGTYIKNKEHFDRLYGDYLDQNVIDKIKDIVA